MFLNVVIETTGVSLLEEGYDFVSKYSLNRN